MLTRVAARSIKSAPLAKPRPKPYRRAMRYPLLVTSYQNPDLDGTASVIAYTEFLRHQGKDATPTLFGSLHPEALHLLERLQVSPPPNLDPREAEHIILLDTSLASDQDPRLPLDRVQEIIDHRAYPELAAFPNAKAQIELVGAAATLVSEHLHQSNFIPTPESAALLYGAIASNTINWRASVTTERDHAMAKWLKSIAPIPHDLVERMFESKSDMTGNKLFLSLEGDFSSRNVAGLDIGIGQLEILHAQTLIRTRRDDILMSLTRLKQRYSTDRAFASAIDLLQNETTFLVPEPDMRAALTGAFNIKFIEDIGVYPDLLLRKQVGPTLKEWYAKTTG